MRLRRRDVPGMALTLIVTVLLGLFIAYPIASVLRESFVISGPMSNQRLKEITIEALAAFPPEDRTDSIDRWTKSATEAERIDAMAAAIDLAGIYAHWDRKAAFGEQARALERHLAELSREQRAAVDENYPIALTMLHKRVALAFKARSAVGEEAFDRLRKGAEARYGLDHYVRVVEEPFLRRAALNSLSLAGVSVAFTVTIAFGLAYAINGGGVRWPSLVRGVVLLPLVAPPILVATATVMLFGRRGLITHGLLDRQFGLIDSDVTNLYGFVGVVIAQTLSFVPAATIVLDNVLRRQNGRMDEAAASLGARRGAIFRKVTLPLAWPGIKRAIALVFILSLTDFGNPLILGRDTPVIAGVIYDEITAFRNTPLAAALCVWLIGPALCLYLVLESLGGRRRYATGEAAGVSELALPRAWRGGLTVLACSVMALITVVYATVILGAFVQVWGVDWSPTLAYFTGEGVNVGLAGTGYGSSDRGLASVWDSLVIAGIAGPLGGLLAIIVAYVIERLRPPGANILAFLALIPAILPGIIFGIGYVVAFNVPFGIKSWSLTGTSAILVINILFSNLFVGVLAARAALQRYDAGIEDAAESLGAGLVQRFWLVTLPMLRPAFLLGALYVFVDGLTTLSSVIFLVSGNHKLAAVSIFNHATSSEFGYAAAKSVVILVVAVAAMAAIWWVEARGRGRKTRDPAPSRPADAIDGLGLPIAAMK